METLRSKAKLILEYEHRMSEKQRNNKQWHPRYLHVLLPADEMGEDSEEDGVISGVKRQLALDKQASGAKLDAMKERMQGQDAKLQVLETKMDTIQAEMKGQQQTLEEVTALVKDMHAVLAAHRPKA